MNSKFLKKLALGLTISICASNSILHSTENIKQNIRDETNIIQTIENIDLKQEIKKFNELRREKDYKYLNELKSKIYDIEDCYSEEMIKLITETAQYYKKTEIISHAFWQIWINCLDNRNKLIEIEKQYKNHKNIIQVIKNKLDEIYKVQDAASHEWVYKRVRLREILHDLREKINNMHQKAPSIDDKLIQEMNTAIDIMVVNK